MSTKYRPPSHFDEFIDEIADRIAARIEAKLSARTGVPQLLTLKQAGERIGRTAGAVGQLVKRGELRAVQGGRRIHIEQEEIQRFIDRNRT